MTDETDIRTNWQRGSVSQQYMLTSGTWQGRVWYLPFSQEWTAVISQANVVVSYNFFKNLVEAQVWCEGRLAELRAQGKC